MKIKEVINYLESIAPVSYQEDYDNAGLIIGDKNQEISSALICLDITEEVIEEARAGNHNLIIAHHPIIFRGLKKLSPKTFTNKNVLKAIKNDIAIYAIHTNLDNVSEGVNKKIAEKLGLQNVKILDPIKGDLKKLVVFCPDIKLSDGQYVPGKVRNAIFEAGAGYIGDYDSCSFNMDGLGTYRGMEGTNPFLGTKGQVNVQKEVKIETIFPAHLQSRIIEKMIEAHPYEEVAYDIYPLDNENPKVGAGVIGELKEKSDELEFLKEVKKTFESKCIKHTKLLNKKIKKVAVCGGSGSFLLNKAMGSGADIFISADFKYHDFFEANNNILIADIGHYESEQFTIDLLHDLLIKKFPTFAISKIKVKTNPINYL
jgi:dinuclear metal center YbgI/SA1388 family protein